MRLALVVPALNEEEAIAGTLRRCLAARAKVTAETPVEEMIVVFVNDGSTDRTQEIVDQPEFREVVKVRFEKNRGYGAAIKAGWKATDADLVGFIDGDGTWNPDFCVPLLKHLLQTEADVVLAGRMNEGSKMPPIRKLGNTIFAGLLSFLSGRTLTDSASGFRIVRRSSLNLIAPLPDRLHFTPAMSCTCLFDPRLRITEIPLQYEERIGRSKLNVVKDGFRFLFTIGFAAFFYAPLRMMLGLAGWTAAFFAALLLLLRALSAPAAVLLGLGILGGFSAVAMIALGILQHQVTRAFIGPRKEPGDAERFLEGRLRNESLMAEGAVFGVLGLLALCLLPFLPFYARMSGHAALGLTLAAAAVSGLGLLAFLGGLGLRAVWTVRDKVNALRDDEFRALTSPARPKEEERRS